MLQMFDNIVFGLLVKNELYIRVWVFMCTLKLFLFISDIITFRSSAGNSQIIEYNKTIWHK